MTAKQYSCVLWVISMALLVGAAGGCKKKPEEVVALTDIKIGYPDAQEQERRMLKFSTVLEQQILLKDPDETLRRIVEQVPFEYVANQLKRMAEEATTSSKPNIGILAERVRQIQSVHDVDTSAFIDKLKEDKNVNALCASLCGLRTEMAQAKVADALASLGDPAATRVVTTLLFSVSGLHEGGSEGEVLREGLRGSLVEALGSCTGLDFSVYDASSESSTLEVVKRCQDWLEQKGL